MKFLFILPRYHINTHYQVLAFKKHNHQVAVFSLYQGKSEDYSAVEPHVLGYAWFRRQDKRVMKSNFEMRYAHPGFFKLFLEIKKNNPDAVIIKNIQSWFSIQSLLIAKILGKKIIILLQLPKYRPKAKSWSVDWVGRLFGAQVLTPILGDQQYPNKNSNLHYVPFVIEAPEFIKKYNLDNKINIVCVGKIQERKGQIFLLQAVKNLSASMPDKFKVDFYGEEDEPAYLAKLQQYIKNNNLEKVVSWHQAVPHQKLLELYKNYDLFVLPSWSEAAAFSILEAMSAKLPVICTDDNGTKNYIEDGVNGYVVRARNAEDLQAKIQAIVKDRETIQKFGQASFDLAKQKHNLDIFYQALIKILK